MSKTNVEQMLPGPLERHAERRQKLDTERSSVVRTSSTISTLRLIAVLGALGIGFARGFGYLPAGFGYLVALLVAAFVVLVVVHTRLYRRLRRIETAISYHDLANTRLTGGWSKCPSRGDRFVSDSHPYTGDLGIFGASSLFQVIDWTHTRLGEETLASWLSAPASRQTILARQAAAKDLAEQWQLREDVAVEGALIAADRPDPEPLLAWADASSVLQVRTARIAAWLVPGMALLVMGASVAGILSATPAAVAFAGAWLVNFAFSRAIEHVYSAVGPHTDALMRYQRILELIEQARLTAPRLQQLADELSASAAGPLEPAAAPASSPAASLSMRRASQWLGSLSRIAGFFDARNNEVFRFFLGPIVLWDVHCVLALERWKRLVGRRARRWLEVIGEFEALSSVATHAADHPDDAWPVISTSPVFAAKGLGHPLLPAQSCVRNDVEVPRAGAALLVTGSNMSGKSTLLRAMGINAVLAMAGSKVCAHALELCVFDVRTSMSARDSLEQGVSFFYAEVQKLKRVIDGLGGERPLFFLLDEILQGTNSRERCIGARTVLRHLVESGAMGAVSTHDVNLWQLGPELEPHLEKVHFEEQVASPESDNPRMSFDYRLRPGIVQSSNALRLMKLVGIDLDFSQPS